MEFFHISGTWKDDLVYIEPRAGRNDAEDDLRDSLPCICVSPTPEQCLIALGRWQDYDALRIYKTNDGNAKPAEWVFDYDLTDEHRFYTPVLFKLITTTTPDKLIKAGVPDINLADSNLRKAKSRMKIILDFVKNNPILV